jgi:hypothetical protein
MSIYEGRLDHGSKQSIPHFGGKDKTVKHMLALCSIFWQAHLRKASEKGRRQYSFNVLPRYATQCGIAAKRCFTASCCLIALDQPGSVEIGQDMLHKRCLHGGKITKSSKCTFFEVVPIDLKRFADSGVALVECPDCSRTRSLSPNKGVLRFPSHDRRKMQTPVTSKRWAAKDKTDWDVVGG